MLYVAGLAPVVSTLSLSELLRDPYDSDFWAHLGDSPDFHHPCIMGVRFRLAHTLIAILNALQT